MLYSGDEFYSAADETSEPTCKMCECHLTLDEVLDGEVVCSECRDDHETEDSYWAKVDDSYHRMLDDSLTG